MKRFLAIATVFLISYSAFGQPSHSPGRPKLVVGIVVDQMRWDYLYRYYERYQSGGFKRLMNNGYRCEQASINYIPSYTAPGHACVYTGSVPSIHGIAGNDWIDNLTGRRWYCTEDTTVAPVGGSRTAGMMSPRNLLATTVTDELRLATNFRSRVFGLAIKDRGAILPAGHLANGAFWYDDSTGNLISSTYYGKALPEWLERFNKKRLSDSLLQQDWQTLYPIKSYTSSIADNNPYEGKFKGEDAPVFPHRTSAKNKYSTLRRIPAGNTYIFKAARACINGEKLGRQGATDFLCVSLSSTDYIGHQFAPNSIEVEDTYLRLDRDIADFLSYLDKTLGKDNYMVFLTADHGGAHNANYLRDLGIPAGNASESGLAKDLNVYLKNRFKHDKLLEGIENYQVFLNHRRIKEAKIEVDALKKAIKEWFHQKADVAYVADMEDIDDTPLPDLIRKKAVNGYNRLRSGDMLVIYNPGWYFGYGATGTTHGTWHPYDTHIPLLWYGWKIPKGGTYRTVHMEDIAATLAALLHIQMPNGCIGKVITELLPPMH